MIAYQAQHDDCDTHVIDGTLDDDTYGWNDDQYDDEEEE